MAERLEGKVAVVTGAASGIGRGTVDLFVKEGARVIAADIQDDKGARIEEDHKGLVHYVRCDVSKEVDIETAVKAAKKYFGRLDCLFNNAGTGGARDPADGVTAEGFDSVMHLHVRAALFGMKYAVTLMKASGGGSIITTASVAGLQSGYGTGTRHRWRPDARTARHGADVGLRADHSGAGRRCRNSDGDDGRTQLRRKRIGAEAIWPHRSTQAAQFDKAPDINRERDESGKKSHVTGVCATNGRDLRLRIAGEQIRHDDKNENPSRRFVAVMQALHGDGEAGNEKRQKCQAPNNGARDSSRIAGPGCRSAIFISAGNGKRISPED